MTSPPPPSAPREVPLIDRLRAATAGRYDIHAELGVGGMATVYRATEIALEREVAIKVMSVEMATAPGAFERFRREALMAAALSHPHIVPIYAIGEDPSLAYFVMKLIEGRGLDSVLRDDGAQPIGVVARTIGVVGRALHYAHERGVVHRDVKPANIMIGADGWTYVTDFGIAKRDDAHGLTQAGTVIGTPAYMSPEQFNGLPITGAADQYSLGIVAFEMFTGRAPFDGPSIGEVMRGHLLDPVPPMRTLRIDVPTGVAECVNRMLEKEPSERFPTLGDAVTALDAAAAVVKDTTTTVRRPPPVASSTSAKSVATSGPLRRPDTAVRPRPRETSSGGSSFLRILLMLIVIGAGGWYALRDRFTARVAPVSLSEAATPMIDSVAAPSSATPIAPDTTSVDESLDSALAAFATRVAGAPIVDAIPLTDSSVVRVGSQMLQTVLFVNDRQIGIVGARGLVGTTVVAGEVTLSVRRLNCQSWDTTFIAIAGRQYTFGERSPNC